MKNAENFLYKLPQCLTPEQLIIFKVPIQMGGAHVYMKMQDDVINEYTPVIVHTDRFLSIWDDSPRIEDGPFKIGVPYASTPELWNADRKLRAGHVEECFAYGIVNPVPMAIVSSITNQKIYFRDGITRTLWLLINKARAFPLACPKNHVNQLVSLAGL